MHGISKSSRSWVAALIALGCWVAPGSAGAWWNEEWSARKPLRLDTSPAGAGIAEPIGATPVLVRLHVGNFRFDAASENGSDLRFIAADDKTPLAHHVEKYDSLLGEALVWVAIPELKPGTPTDVWLYYGNPKATSAEDPKATYDAATRLVYHFAEQGQPPRDSSAAGNHAQSAGQSAEGAIVGRGLRLDGTGGVIIPAAPSLAWTAGAAMTWSAWVKPAEAASTGVIFSRRDGASAFVVGLDAGKAYVEIGGGAGPKRAAATVELAAGTWHHLAIAAGREIALYVDGAPAAQLAAAVPALDAASAIGAAPGQGGRAPLPGLKGELDELQLANVERPAGFLRAAAVSQGSDPGKFLAAGQDEERGGGGGHGGYLAILMGAVTLDGWIVIGILGVMAVVSWMVMVGKAGYLGAVEKANGAFQESFRHQSADLIALVNTSNGVSPLGDERMIRNSSLYRIFAIAAEEIRKRTSSRRALSAESIESIRASMDAGLVRENQRLSRRMVLLTIAISGGPFLGLLGTVVGVMITFAAIAAAGDVNVNAIAPGIAAALVATVAGLAVAIPALFGYNWLLTRIKDVTATMQVFVDELVTKVAEVYAAGAAREERAARSTPINAE